MRASNKCPSCGGEDHARASSHKCANRKRRVREEAVPPTHELRRYTIKKCFRGFVRRDNGTGLKELLVREVRRDVRDLSGLAIEVSLSIAFFYSHYLTRLGGSRFLQAYPKCNAARFVSALKCNGVAKKKTTPFLEDPDDVLASYMSLRLKPDLKYDGVWRNQLCTYIAKRYETELETAITTHAFKRIRRFLMYQRAVGQEQGLSKETKKAIHEACFARYYNTPLMNRTEESGWIDEWFNSHEIDVNAVAKNYWRFLPLFTTIQDTFACDPTQHSFKLFPVYSHGAKHLTYDSTALFELLRRVDRAKVPSTWKEFNLCGDDGVPGAREYWKRYFCCPKKRFGFLIQTDGVSVSISMNGIALKKEKKAAASSSKRKRKKLCDQKNEEDTRMDGDLNSDPSRFVAVDPGARAPIVTCTFDGATNKYVYQTLNAGTVKYQTNEMWRKT